MRTIKHTSFAALVAAFLSTVDTMGANATSYYIYNYTGKDFTTFLAPYTAGDYVSGSFTFTQPLGDNYSSDANPIDYSLSDGVQTLGNPLLNTLFFFQTNGTGQIDQWEITIENDTTLQKIETINLPGTFIYDAANNGNDSGANVGPDPGSWSEEILEIPSCMTNFCPTPTPTTPLPAALPLFATGLGAMGLLGWRKKRKGAAALAAAQPKTPGITVTLHQNICLR